MRWVKVLILTCSTGEGHNSCAAAIREAFEAQGIPCDVMDALGLVSEKLSSFICNWHTRIYRYIPKAFGSGYAYTENHRTFLSEGKWNLQYMMPGAEKLHALLWEQGYNALICTHVFGAAMATQMRNKYGRGALTCFLATDYTCSPTVEDNDADIYFIPAEDLAGEFTAAGLPAQNLAATGIPVRQDFYAPEAKAQAKAKLGLPQDMENVLLMCGSMGCGPIEELAEALSQRLPAHTLLSVVCGTNDKLLRALEKKQLENVRLFGYTRQIPLLMDSVELFLTKPGGISVTEAAVKGLPMLFINAVGGCETHNLNYFTTRGWAETAEGPEALASKCVAMLQDREALGRRAAGLRAAFPKNAAQEIAACVQAWAGQAAQREMG